MANTNKVAWGLKKLSMAEVGAISASTEWTEIGDVLEGSITLNFEAPTASEVRVEEKDTAILTKYVSGAKGIGFDIPNVDPDMLTLICDAVTKDGITYFPDDVVIKHKMFKFDFLSGDSFYIFNGTMVTNPAGGITKTGADVFQVHVEIGINAGGVNESGIGIGTFAAE